jgi:hypothetical protein
MRSPMRSSAEGRGQKLQTVPVTLREVHFDFRDGTLRRLGEQV